MMRGRCSDIENYAAIYFAGPEAIEDIVDRLQRLVLDGCLYLALGGKGERFFKVQTGSDDRAAKRVAVEDHVEDGDGELARRQTVEDAGAAATQHADGLPEGGQRDGRHQHAMSASDLLLDCGHRILLACIDCDLGSELACQPHFFRSDIDGGNMQSHGLRVLQGNVTETADSGDDDPFAGTHFRLLESFVGGDACAQDRGGIPEGQGIGDAAEESAAPSAYSAKVPFTE